MIDAGKQLGLQTILAIMQILDQTLSRMKYSTQARILAELALVRISNLEDLEELSGLIAQLQSGQAGGERAGRAGSGLRHRPRSRQRAGNSRPQADARRPRRKKKV